MNEKKFLYIALAGLNYLLGSTWVLALYNDPSLLGAKSTQDWIVVGCITLLFTLQSAFIAWKAFTSDPRVADSRPPKDSPTQDPNTNP